MRSNLTNVFNCNRIENNFLQFSNVLTSSTTTTISNSKRDELEIYSRSEYVINFRDKETIDGKCYKCK